MAVRDDKNSVGYLCGRLCALYEACRREHNDREIATLFDDWYFSTKISFSKANNLLATYPQTPLKSRAERLIAKIVNRLNDIPDRLDVENQGEFALGYYHQRYDSVWLTHKDA